MRLTEWEDIDKRERHLHLVITDEELARVKLDAFDRAVLATPKKGIADVLQDAQLLAWRIEQQDRRG